MKLMISAITRIFRYLLIVSMIHMVGCTEFRSLQRAEGVSNPYGVSVGDTVLLVTTDAQHFEFKITDLTETAIIGDHVEIPFDEISVAKKQEIDEAKTAKAVGGPILGIGAVWLIFLMLTATIVVFPA
jgi:hypothetical protein